MIFKSMKILISAIGRAKNSHTSQLYSEYEKRLPCKITLKEFEAKVSSAAARKEKEGELLLESCLGYDVIIALDETGENLSSREFAERFANWQQRGNSSFAFVIGGADGLSRQVLGKANLVWSFGRLTWPHMLVRPMLAEQIYRAFTLNSGHPYHRE